MLLSWGVIMKMDIKRDKKFININRKMKINNILLKGILVIIFIILMIILTFIYKIVVSKKINLFQSYLHQICYK